VNDNPGNLGGNVHPTSVSTEKQHYNTIYRDYLVSKLLDMGYSSNKTHIKHTHDMHSEKLQTSVSVEKEHQNIDQNYEE
jgi:hypothetical protein